LSVRALSVELAERSCPVLVGPGVRHEVARFVPGTATLAAVVTQESIVEAGWLDAFDAGVPHEICLIEDGEPAKSLATVERLARAFARRGLSRADVVVAVGGGIVTDVAGFAAATYHRGTAYVNVATSLLAQVDAAVGGKTGVNLPEGKNLVGAFWQPNAVLCDTETLATLPPREWACGRGEMAKYAFLGEPPSPDQPIEEQVARCVAIKAAVVGEDERETGRRTILNYGHTLAHALEGVGLSRRLSANGRADGTSTSTSADRWDLRHGEAVAIGLVFAANLARRVGRIDEARVEEHRAVVGGYDLPADLPPGADARELLEFMSRDKKAQQDLAFVLDGPRGVELVRGVAVSDVLATLADMGART
jgi:5-deoxy-5-amino-3-dehydroquinate synthase